MCDAGDFEFANNEISCQRWAPAIEIYEESVERRNKLSPENGFLTNMTEIGPTTHYNKKQRHIAQVQPSS